MEQAQYDSAQEAFLEDEYSDFNYAISVGNYADARRIIDEVHGLGYGTVSKDMQIQLANKRLHE